MTPRLDVIVPTTREAGPLEPVLAALSRALEAAALEPSRVTVVDDRPGRGAIEGLVAGIGFRYTATAGARGPGGARNAGRAGSAPWVLFVDDDVELDRDSLQHLLRRIADPRLPCAAVMGGLRPPPSAPGWFHAADRRLTTMAASAAAGSGPAPPTHLCAAVVAIRRSALDAAGWFPEVPTWEDAVLGLRLARAWHGPCLERDVAVSGVHHTVPADWRAWLARQHAAGGRLAALRNEIAPVEHRALLAALHMDGGPRAVVKRAAARLPPAVWGRARGSPWRRLAASAAFARGYLGGRSSR